MEGGVSGVVVVGLIGEVVILFDDEYDLLLCSVVKVVGGCILVLVGIGLLGIVKIIE